jgi:uncharacterized membrane protein/uncharacterized RDD family membrane protein YckC
MVDPSQLANDIAGNTVSLLLPAVLWVLVFLLAWEHGPFAESIGFGRKAFWLLVPGALLSSFALVPFAPVSTDWVAVSLSGAVFPLLVGLLAFGRAAPPRSRSLALFLGLLAAEGAILFALVLPGTVSWSQAVARWVGVSEYIGNELLVTIVAAVVTAAVGGGAVASGSALARRVAFLFALSSGALVATFATAAAVPGVGITEPFPFFLFPPILVGFAAAGFASRVFPKEEAFAIPTAFLGSTFGVLLGADLLRQPPLYGQGPSGVYTIGGAGVLDLVYISGLLAFSTAYLVHRGLERGWAPVGSPPIPAPAPSAFGRLSHSFQDGIAGKLSDSLRDAAGASHAAAVQAHRLNGLAAAPDDRPWQGLGVPGWVVADQANLDASARAGTQDGREAFRSWRAASAFVLIGRDLGMRRFGTLVARTVAFLVDLAVVTAPAVALWVALLETIPGSLDDALSNVGFNAAIFGFIAWAFFYLVLTETFLGTTVGKRLLGLEVRDRSLDAPSGLAALVRNTTVVPLLTVFGIGLAIALAFGIKAGSTGTEVVAGVSLPLGLLALVSVLLFVLGGVALLGAGAVIFIVATTERQRLGDLWAGTWVVRTVPPVPTGAVVPPAGAAPPPPKPGPPG